MIALVLFVAMFSLLVLAIVTGVYFTSVLTNTRAQKLEVVAELKSAQLQQTMDTNYFDVLQLSEREVVQRALTIRKAGNTSRAALQSVQQLLEQTLDATTSMSYARIYDLDLELVANVFHSYATYNASEEALNELFILDKYRTEDITTIPSSLLNNRGYLLGPVQDEEAYFYSLTLPIYANESILVPQQFLSGYITVALNMRTVNSTLDEAKNTEYTSINYISPVSSSNNITDYVGFRYIFSNPVLEESNIDTEETFPLKAYQPAVQVFTDASDLGSYTKLKNPAEQIVALGYSVIDLRLATWLVTVEQVHSEFEGPITKLIKIMVGLCIGLAAAMCIITFPLAHYGVRPILKLQKATEDITERRGLKKKRRKHINAFQKMMKGSFHENHNKLDHQLGDKEDEKNISFSNPSSPDSMHFPVAHSSPTSVRNSWNGSSNDSLGNSFSQEYGDSLNSSNVQRHSDNQIVPSIVQTNGIFFDELTELTEAFNVMTMELDRQYTHLEDRVRARTKELEKAKIQADLARQQAEKANEAKTVFIANISHELRTPLNGILGMTSVAMGEKDIDKIQNSLELIFKSGELLLHILVQLLTFSKNQLDKSKLQKKNFLITEVASQIKFIFGKAAVDQDVNLIISLKPNLIRKIILYGDSNRIIQVVMNLVSNSLKFTPENGTVKVLIELLGTYDEERSKNSNYEKVYVKGFEKDMSHYHVRPIESSLHVNGEDSKICSTDTSSIISSKSTSTLSTLRSSVYIKSLSELYKTPNTEIQYFNDDQFIESDIQKSSDLHQRNHKCYRFGNIDENCVVRFSVSDTGTGIDKSLQDKIFDAFIQGDQTLSRSHGGTGLGLSICKQFAKMMHGTLTLDSEVGRGSTFTFTIPLPRAGEIIMDDDEFEEFSKDDFNDKYNKKKKVTFLDDGESSVKSPNNKYPKSNASTFSHSQESNETPEGDHQTYVKPELVTRASTGTAQSYKSSKSHLSSSVIPPALAEESGWDLKLLVAEDNLVNQEVVKRMLQLEGITNISMARDGKDAVEFVRETINSKTEPYDLILMDVQMPNMDGLTATKIIRTELGYTGPIVALTAFADISNEKGCIDAGMSGFLSKPIRRNLLVGILKQLFDDKDKNTRRSI